MKLHVGTSGFGYKAWKGKFYPKDLPDDDLLRFYGERFDSVEINNTFYRMPAPALLESWAGKVPLNFRFAIKAPQQITHQLQLLNAQEPLARLFHAADALGKRLGPVLFQLPPFLKKDVPRLREFLRLPRPADQWAFEFRHASWLAAPVFDLLAEHKTALCLAETDDDLEVPIVATTDWGYLRLRRSEYGEADLKSWSQRIRQQKWKQAFIFFKHEDEASGTLAAKKFVELAN